VLSLCASFSPAHPRNAKAFRFPGEGLQTPRVAKWSGGLRRTEAALAWSESNRPTTTLLSERLFQQRLHLAFGRHRV